MAIYNKTTSSKLYNVMLMLPKEMLPLIDSAQKEIEESCIWVYNLRSAHITVKYLGYHKNYSENYILRLFPEIKRLCKIFLPIRIKIKGFKFVKVKAGISDILMILDYNEGLIGLHNSLKSSLGPRIDHFRKFEGRNYLPHIVLGRCRNQDIPKIKQILKCIKIPKRSFKIRSVNVHLKGNKIVSLIN